MGSSDEKFPFRQRASMSACMSDGTARTREPFVVSAEAPVFSGRRASSRCTLPLVVCAWTVPPPDRKSTRLNSSHVEISYAVFCLKKKKKNSDISHTQKKKKKKIKTNN